MLTGAEMAGTMRLDAPVVPAAVTAAFPTVDPMPGWKVEMVTAALPAPGAMMSASLVAAAAMVAEVANMPREAFGATAVTLTAAVPAVCPVPA
jgi:hypothetical protein